MHCPEVKNVCCEDRDECLFSWDVSDSTPLIIRLPSRVASTHTLCAQANLSFFKTLQECTPVMVDVLFSDEI